MSASPNNASPSPPGPIAPRASRWEWALAGLLALNLAWTTLANGGYGARIELVTLYLTAALVVLYALAEAVGTGGRRPLHPAGWLFLPFLLYALGNVLWVTPVRWLGWRDWLGWVQLTVVFWVALNGLRARAPRQVVFRALIVLGIIGVLLACYQRFVRPEWRLIGEDRGMSFGGRASGPFGMPNSFAGFLLLLLPAVAALALRRAASEVQRVWWGWVALVLLFGLGLTISRGAWLALAGALVCWPLVTKRGSWRRRATVALVVLAFLAVAGTVVLTKYPEAGARFRQMVADAGEVTRPHMWRGAWRLFGDAPLVGTGAGSYNVLFERHRPEGFRDEPLWAHNEYLNTLSDYGAVGFLLFFGAAGTVGWKCRHRAKAPPVRVREEDSWLADGLWMGLAAFALHLMVEFHFKIPALAIAAAVIAAMLASLRWRVDRTAGSTTARSRREGVFWLGVAAATCWAVIAWVRPKFEADALQAAAHRALARLPEMAAESTEYAHSVDAAQAQLTKAVNLDPANGDAWAGLGYAIVLAASQKSERTMELGREAEAAVDRALTLAKGQHAGFWLRRGLARDLQGRWFEAGEDFTRAVALAPANATMWYFQAEHLSRVAATREAAEAVLGVCLRLDPWNKEGLALRQRLALKKTSPK